jgi:peroxiredoxin
MPPNRTAGTCPYGVAGDAQWFHQGVALATFRGKWMVLCFYSLGSTLVCLIELRGFNGCTREFTELKAAVVGISVDSVYTHLAWVEHGLGELHFPLLSDITMQISRDYGVFLEDAGISPRATVLIDQRGWCGVRWSTILPLAVAPMKYSGYCGLSRRMSRHSATTGSPVSPCLVVNRVCGGMRYHRIPLPAASLPQR